MDPKADLLKQLQDIELPERSGPWLAPGWMLLLLVLVGSLIFLYWCWKRYQHYRRTNWRPEAREIINTLRTDIENRRYDRVLSECSRLVRRVALARDSREEVASLTGKAWLLKLDALSDSTEFTKGAGRLLGSAQYRKGNIEDSALLLGVVDAVELLVEGKRPEEEQKSSRIKRLRSLGQPFGRGES